VFAVASGTHDADATNEGTFDKYAVPGVVLGLTGW